jgi:type III secretion protein R
VGDLQIAELSSLSVASLKGHAGHIVGPWRDFLLRHSGDREISVFKSLEQPGTAGVDVKEADQEVSTNVALGAFVLSEIKKGFLIGVFLLVPFFVIDLVVANLLVALGLTMMSPVVVSLPIKLLLFISTDGWLLLARNLIQAYQ